MALAWNSRTTMVLKLMKISNITVVMRNHTVVLDILHFTRKTCMKVVQFLNLMVLNSKKKPNEGRMSNLAFAYDPDGYWIEIVAREKTTYSGFNFSQTMIRIKDPAKSLAFYRDLLGMEIIKERHFEEAKFSLYFMASKRKNGEDEDKNPMTLFHPVLELTHNHGTENDENFSYHNGNTDPKGFGHTGFLVDDLSKACEFLEDNKVQFKKKPEEGKMRGIAFVCDPDGYWVELIQRGATF
mmetsp:Transcript_78596/g.118205  ORF Transcript_78596/g.118205 Transcript_78596/m.118205 type:complete len:240 (+) Transcript_78596:220-939(+)